MERSLRVKMFDFDPFGRFSFAAGKYTGHSEQDVARVPTLSRFATLMVIFMLIFMLISSFHCFEKRGI